MACYFSKISIITNKAPLVLIFSGGYMLLVKLIITCQSKQKTTNQINQFTNVVGVIVFWANQDFSIKCHTEKQSKNKKLNIRRVFLNWKISKNRAVCKH